DRWRSIGQREVVVRGVGDAVGTDQVRIDGGRVPAPGAGGHPGALAAGGGQVAGVGPVKRRAVDLAEPIAADQVVQKVDPGGVGRRRRFASDAVAAANGAGRGPVAGDGVVDEEDFLAAGHIHAVPGDAVDRVADQVVRAADDVDGRDPVAAVAVGQAGDDEGDGADNSRGH